MMGRPLSKRSGVGGFLCSRRKALGLRLVDVAARAGVTTGQVSFYERNKTYLKASFFKQYAKALEMNLTEFVAKVVSLQMQETE